MYLRTPVMNNFMIKVVDSKFIFMAFVPNMIITALEGIGDKAVR